MSRRLPVSLFVIIILVLILMSASVLALATGSPLPWPEQQETVDAAIDDLFTQTAQAEMQMNALETIDAAFPGELTRTAEFGATVDMGLQLTLTAFVEGAATPTVTQTSMPANSTTATPTHTPAPTEDTSAGTLAAKTLTAEALQPAQADAPMATLNVATGPVRAEPLPSAETVVELEVGAVVSVLGRTDDNNWLFIRTVDGVTGWMSRSLLTIDFNVVNALPIVTGEADIATLAPPLTDGNASMYALMPILDRPDSVDGERIAEVQRGDRVTVLGESQDGRFFYVRLADSTEGWVLRATVNFDGDESELPVLDPNNPVAPEELLSPTPTPPQPTATPLTPARPPATLTPDTAQADPTPTQIGADASREVPGALNISSANIRSSPELGADAVVRLIQGEEFVVLGRTANNNYVYVRTAAGVEGWLALRFVDLTVEPGDLPVITPALP